MLRFDPKAAELAFIPSTTPGHVWRVYVYKQPGHYAYATAVEGAPDASHGALVVSYVFPQPRKVERCNIMQVRATPKAKNEAIAVVVNRLCDAGFITGEWRVKALDAIAGILSELDASRATETA